MNKNSFKRKFKEQQMKFKSLIAAIGIIALLLSSKAYAITPYVQGYRLYIRYIKHIPGAGIKAPQLLKKLNVITEEQFQNLFKNNAQELIQKTEAFDPKAAKAIQKIVKEGKLKYLKAFLHGIFEGKIPPG